MDLLHKIVIGQTIVAAGRYDAGDEIPDNPYEKEHPILEKLSPRKKSEWIHSRNLLYSLSPLVTGKECLYDDFGKPVLTESDLHISVSHSQGFASAMISPFSCGVDIQVYSDTVNRIAERFMSAHEEKTFLGADRYKRLHLLWGAKECMYKAYGKRKLEFRKNIFIRSIDFQQNSGSGEIINDTIHLSYDLYYRFLPEAAWIFCIERPVADNNNLRL